MNALHAHILRALAPLPPGSPILVVGCGEEALVEALVRLGFRLSVCDTSAAAIRRMQDRIAEAADADATAVVFADVPSYDAALPFEDESFFWIVSVGSMGREAASLPGELAACRRVLVSGGWLTLAPAGPISPGDLEQLLSMVGYAQAEPAAWLEGTNGPLLHAIFRRVDADTRP